MEKKFEELLEEFKEHIKKIKQYTDTMELLAWDLRTGAPKKGLEERAETIGMLSNEAFNLLVSAEMKGFLEFFEIPANNEKLEPIIKAAVRECRKEYDKFNKIPGDMYKEYVVLTSKAESIWEDAKNSNKYEVFSPYLEKIVDYNQKFIDIWGFSGNRYNTLLDIYEPGMTVEKLDKIFGRLRAEIVPLVAKIKDCKQNDTVFHGRFSKEKQQEFAFFILDKMGFDMEAGRLDESEHPFTVGITTGDVRITTHYYMDSPINALYSTMHEAGHGMYEQNISTDLNNTPLCTGASMGIHESQSRFWENLIGKSKSFWDCYYKELQHIFPEHLEKLSEEAFYKEVNKVEASLIRIDADELTYNLHIMIRYEIEKALFNNEITVGQLPQIWNQKMKEYLGIVPQSDKEGLLQDVHWAGGSFGYFPSYTLGNIYAAQFYNALNKDYPNLDEMIKKGQLHEIKNWLTKKIYKHGKMLQPSEIVMAVTGEEINPDYFVKYLKSKFEGIYSV